MSNSDSQSDSSSKSETDSDVEMISNDEVCIPQVLAQCNTNIDCSSSLLTCFL
jgi:hypothetical protein